VKILNIKTMDKISFIRTIGDFRSSVNEDIRPSWLRLTTITLVSKYLKEQGVTLDPQRMQKVFDKIKVIPIEQTGGGSFRWQAFYSSFYNQITIGYKDALSTKKVKIFPNGSLQIAGCVDMDDCERFISQFQIIMRLVYDVDVPMDSFRIVMINSNFTLNHEINLMEVIDIFDNSVNVIDFNPDRYSAVKMKFKSMADGKQVTASIFSTGSVIITGAERFDEVCQAYIYIVSTLLANISRVYISKIISNKNFDYFMGYSYSEWYSKIMSE
jgi:TATA-box binding protein (TBP) (component of TFIID and TFIIIB)